MQIVSLNELLQSGLKISHRSGHSCLPLSFCILEKGDRALTLSRICLLKGGKGMSTAQNTRPSQKTGTREQWLTQRVELLKAEKDLTRRSDELRALNAAPRNTKS